MARIVTDAQTGMLAGGRMLIVDRDAKCCAAFRVFLERSGTRTVRLLPRAPNLKAYAERFVGSINAECLNRLIFVGEASLRRAVREYCAHYHHERDELRRRIAYYDLHPDERGKSLAQIKGGLRARS